MLKRIWIISIAAALATCLCACSANSGESSKTVQTSSQNTSAQQEQQKQQDLSGLRIASMKGPTSVGLAYMMQTTNADFQVVASADEVTPLLLKGDVDIACVPANLAAMLYQKTNGSIRVLNINTLGVLNVVTQDAGISAIDQLRGRTIYMTGKGTVPEFTFAGVLEAFGLTFNDIDLQFRTEPAEIAAMLVQDASAIGVLPQPYATSVTLKDSSVRIAVDLTQAWEQATGEQLVTGVAVASAAFADGNPSLVEAFLSAAKESSEVAQNQPDQIAQTVVDLKIIDSLQLAEAAIPACNVTCITGQDMRNTLERYLQMLFAQSPESVGGTLPGPEFYYGT